jgi:hypothetical protein
MSRFLAPIHTWLFNKIKLYEGLERDIISNFTDIDDILEDIQNNFVSPLDDSPIEDVIDATNIHGWLQNRISVAEIRQAYLITKLVEKFGDEGFRLVEKAYLAQGTTCGKDASEKYDVGTPNDLFKAIYNYILEGMPCDNANSVTRNEADIIEWITVVDLHGDYWENAGGNAANFYELRKAWISSFVEAANPDFKYSFDIKYLNEVKKYLNNIVRK